MGDRDLLRRIYEFLECVLPSHLREATDAHVKSIDSARDVLMHRRVPPVHTTSAIRLNILLFLLILLRNTICLALVGGIVIVLIDFDGIGKIVLLVDYDFVVVFCVSGVCYGGQALLVDDLVVYDLGLATRVLLVVVAGWIQDALLGL